MDKEIRVGSVLVVIALIMIVASLSLSIYSFHSTLKDREEHKELTKKIKDLKKKKMEMFKSLSQDLYIIESELDSIKKVKSQTKVVTKIIKVPEEKKEEPKEKTSVKNRSETNVTNIRNVENIERRNTYSKKRRPVNP